MNNMARFISYGIVILVASDLSQSFTSRLDFGEEEESTSMVNNSDKENENVEVQHTIVVLTKLKNNNIRGLQISRDDDNDAPMRRSGQLQSRKRDDSGEVPVVQGYKALETTQILTPDTRLKQTTANMPRKYNLDEYDIYPNIATNPMQFKPSNFYNNINWWNQDNSRSYLDSSGFIRQNGGTNSNVKPGFHRSLNDDSVKEFYCKKCREMGGEETSLGCDQRRNSWRNKNTTPRVKVDGKLAKLT